ncbi:vasculin-like protein 1-like [Scleropages formosus]|uniref:Vasculin-like protein 1-like n=1 Tax=Scleropages formosus TaxID=113540 RepID=A0A0P7Z7H7_SCLFO|nr:vasculin-like protein 1-like [Scleropages formosus]
MAQHDFVPAWLNFATPQSAKSPPSSFEKHGEHLSRGDGRPKVSRRRHNSSDGFFNNEPFRAPADGWQQPSLLRHDSVDSGVSKGSQGGLVSGPSWKESSGWQGTPWSQESSTSHHHHHHSRNPKRGGERDRERPGGHRQRNGNFHPRKGASVQDKFSDEEQKEDKLKFVEEDFPSLNPEVTGKQASLARTVGMPAGVWENPPSAKQATSKVLVIKKVSKEDPCAAFSAGFASPGPFPTNGTRVPSTAPSVYKNLVPKPAATPNKPALWKPNGREAKPGLHFSGRDSAFTSPVLVTKPLTPVSTPSNTASKEHPSSTTPPVDITPSRLKLMRRGGTDRKSEFLRALKDETNGEESHGIHEEGDDSPLEAKEQSEALCHKNGVSHSLSDSDTEHLSSSLEAEHRLLKSMGWQEYPENDENFLPLTEEELKEFQEKTEQLKRNGVLLKAGAVSLPLSPWRGPANTGLTEGSESETSSSSQTSDDDT